MFEYLSCLFVTFFGVCCVLYEMTETLITLLVGPAFGAGIDYDLVASCHLFINYMPYGFIYTDTDIIYYILSVRCFFTDITVCILG